MLVTFSGLDGSGKTTLIRGLTKALEAQGKRVRVLTMYDHVGVYAALRLIRDRLGAKPRPQNSQAAGHGSSLMRVVRNPNVKRSLYEIDLGFFQLSRAYHERLRGCVLILDRYFYDSIVDLTEEADERRRAKLLRWVPTPDLPIYVDASPDIAFARKGEYSVDRLERRRQIYQQMFAGIDRALIVRNDVAAPAVSVEAIKSRLLG